MATTLTDRNYGIETSVAIKPPVQAVATVNVNVQVGGIAPITTTAGQFTPNPGSSQAAADRILLPSQTNQTENGIWSANTGAWIRTGDFDGNRDAVPGTLIVYQGPAGTVFYQVQLAAGAPPGNVITIGTTPINITAIAALPPAPPINTAYYPTTDIERVGGVVPVNSFPLGTPYRYAAKGGAVRISDAVITAGNPIVTSASGGFAKAVAGMVCVVIDGGASRAGGRPAPLLTTILSVQSANQITLNTNLIQVGSVTFNGTLNSNATISAPSINPITAGVGLCRTWSASSSGGHIPAGATISATSATTLTLSGNATATGAESITLTAPAEICFGWDDHAALATAASLPYPITDPVDNFLSTLPLSLGLTGCNSLSMRGSKIFFALANNVQHCVTMTGFDRTNAIAFNAGMRYTPFDFDLPEIDCCNTGLDGLQLLQSNFSRVRARVLNTYRNAFGEIFTVDGHWQEGNQVDISCARIGLHFQHKVNKAQVYQNLATYRIQGRSCGLNSVWLGINATTQKDQLGGGIRIYGGGNAVADGGINQNTWGMGASCELDAQRVIALSFGSDVCNSAVSFVDASAAYVIEGSAGAAFSNSYRWSLFGAMVIEDISESADARGGYQYFAAPGTTFQSNTILSPAAGPWGQTIYNAAVWLAAGTDNLIRFVGSLAYAGSLTITGQVGFNGSSPAAPQTGWGVPINGAVIANFNGSGATLLQTSEALASVLSALLAAGIGIKA